MAAFVALDWWRIDLTAIVIYSGLAAIDARRHQACRDWLLRDGYEIDTFDCRPGLAVAVAELGQLLRWQEQFGYTLDSDSRNLNALRDGFDFTVPEGGGRVFEIIRPDLAGEEDPRWLCGLLSMAQEHCREQLAIGRRFFALLVVPEQSPLTGAMIEEVRVPNADWNPCREVHEFT